MCFTDKLWQNQIKLAVSYFEESLIGIAIIALDLILDVYSFAGLSTKAGVFLSPKT